MNAFKLLKLLLLISYISSCGLKTDPKSDIEDFRPEIPFKEKPAKPPQAKKEKLIDEKN